MLIWSKFFLQTTLLLLMVMCLLTSAIVAQEQVSVCRIRQHIEYLASEELAGRRGVNALRAAEYVAEELSQLGLSPVFPENNWLQPVPGPVDEQGLPTVAGWNVTAKWTHPQAKFPEEYVLIAAHHDHLGRTERGIYFGADDNASGVAMVLEVARQLAQSKTPIDRSVLFVSFDLEEHLLFGSRWWVAHPPVPVHKIKFVIVADMLGRSLGNLPLDSVFLFGAEHGQGVRELVRSVSTDVTTQPILLSDDFVGLRSDYGPFRSREIPFIFASTGQSRDYHTIEDRPEKIDMEQVAAITELLSKLLLKVANLESGPQWVGKPQIERAEVQAVHHICQMIDEHAHAWQLTPVQRFFVNQARSRAERMLQQNHYSKDDEAWLTRTTQMLLFTVF